MKKILVLDDDVELLYLMQMILSTNNYRVEAIVHWEDIDDGCHLCKKIKWAKNTEHIQVILFSANRESENNFRDLLAENFLGKLLIISFIKDH